MKFFMLMLLVSPSFAGSAIPFHPPQSQPLSCQESCQYFDTFEHKCDYRTQCVYDQKSSCMTHTSCEHWDNLQRECQYETKTTTCHVPNPFVPAPECKVSCQYWDNFENRCLYETRCEYNPPNCLATTQCVRWDTFNKVCLSEDKILFCP